MSEEAAERKTAEEQRAKAEADGNFEQLFKSSELERVSLTTEQLDGLTRTARGETGKTSRVDSKKTYGGWLKDQPVEFIDEALGPKRSALFRSGAIKIDGFTDSTGRVYTLKELEGMSSISMQ